MTSLDNLETTFFRLTMAIIIIYKFGFGNFEKSSNDRDVNIFKPVHDISQ